MNPETLGLTVIVEHESGGKLGSWFLDFDDAFDHIKRTYGSGDNYIRIFPTRFKDRMRLK